MAVVTHQIGSFLLLDLTPAPPNPVRRTFVETRNGVDGYAVWYDATRGAEYRPSSTVDAITRVYAQGTIKPAYENAVGSVVTVVHSGFSYPNILIRDVDVQITDTVYGIGGLAVPYATAMVRATWDMVVLETP